MSVKSKNIHVLPTDKPSRVRIGNNGNFVIGLSQNTTVSKNDSYTNQNIYITSDEEIKVGDWMIRNNEQPIKLTKGFFWDFGVRYYKIILTTDQDLMDDGVQAIDDEFLKWFVKNPSCEEVEVEKMFNVVQFTSREYIYKIIIPKEEPKQDLEKEMFELEQELDIPSHLRWHNSKPKQETPEEVKDLSYYKTNAEEDYLKVPISVLRYISQLEQEQDKNKYSEEDMILYSDYVLMLSAEKTFKTPLQPKEWFEQLKKK